MTEAPTSGDVTRLTAAVEALSRSSKANTTELARVWASLRRHRRALIASWVSLLIDLALSLFGVFAIFALIRFHDTQEALNSRQDELNRQQTCINSTSQQFFAAEIGKVQGQIAGERQKLAGVRLILQGGHAEAGLAQYVQGEEAWISASRHYLATIHAIKDTC